MSRRAVVGAATLLLARPHVVWAAPPTDTDVAIIGAGAAGLSAARVLRSDGVAFEVIEARDRLGGRAHTDTGYFGVPVDMGCAELHNAKVNPWVAYARRAGFKIGRLPSENAVFDGSHRLSERELDALSAEFSTRQSLLQRTCALRRDMSVSEAITEAGAGRWSDSIRLWLGPISAGLDLEDWSLLDWCAGRSGENWHAPAGFGTVIAHSGRGMPIHLNTPVQEIDWSGRSVNVNTADGTIRARAVIVTLPVGVLKSELVRFTPGLPAWKLRALDGMAVADYLRILLKLRGDAFGQPDGSWIAHRIEGSEGFSFWINPGGHGVTHALAGGQFARKLELTSADEAVDAALQVIRGLLGSKIDAAFDEGTITVWAQDPYARGAWAHVRPHNVGAREALLAPLAGRVFFAGDAMHGQMPGTAGGAALVGEAVARAVARVLRRS